MDHRISRSGVALCIVLALIAVATFAYLNEAFEGPSAISAIEPEGYELTASFKDTEGLPTKQPVLSKGVQVGKVTSVDYERETSTGIVTFTIDDHYAPIYKDASVTIGERSVLGDPYLRLDFGTEAAGELEPGSEIASLPSVDFDEAFDFLDAAGRRHLDNLIETIGDGTGDPQNGEQISGTVAGLSRTLVELNRLTETLKGQEPQLGSLVSDTSTVVTELGSREAALRTIVAAGRITLDAVADNTASVEDALTEAPLLLDTGTKALAAARPLLLEAQPLVADLRALAPNLEPAVDALPGLTADATAVIEGLEPLREAAEPAFGTFLELLRKTPPLIEALVPGLRNLVPSLEYIGPRADTIGAFFANLVSATHNGDSVGKWARFHIFIEPGTFLDSPLPATCYPEDDVATNVGVCNNAFPEAGDANDPEPYVPGSYEHLMPFDIPPPP